MLSMVPELQVLALTSYLGGDPRVQEVSCFLTGSTSAVLMCSGLRAGCECWNCQLRPQSPNQVLGLPKASAQPWKANFSLSVGPTLPDLPEL